MAKAAFVISDVVRSAPSNVRSGPSHSILATWLVLLTDRSHSSNIAARRSFLERCHLLPPGCVILAPAIRCRIEICSWASERCAGNWEQTRIHYERALARDPDFKPLIPALKRLRAFDNKREAGKQAMAKKHYEEAIERYTEALEIDPENTHMRVLLKSNRALALNALKRYDEAIADCESVLAVDSGHWKALRSRARAELNLEKYEEAVASFKASLEAIEDSDKDQNSVKAELQNAEKEVSDFLSPLLGHTLMPSFSTQLKRSKQKDYYKVCSSPLPVAWTHIDGPRSCRTLV